MSDTPPVELDKKGLTAELWAQAARTLTAFAVIGSSIVLYVQQVIRTKWVDAFILNNTLSKPDRTVLLITMIVGAGLSVLIPAAYLLWKRTPRAVENLRRLSHVLSPLALLGATPAVFRVAPWRSDVMRLAVTLAIYVLVLERTVAASLAAMPDRIVRWSRRIWEWPATRLPRFFRALPLALVIAGAVGFAISISILTIRHHHKLGTAAYDLGIFNNLFYNALIGHPFRSYVQVPGGDWSSLQAHAELSTFFFLPFYALSPRAETILVLQAVCVAAGAIPVYLIAQRRISRFAAMLVAACYLLYAPAHSGIFYDFHFQPVATPFVLWAFYFLDVRKNLPFAVFFLIALGCREDISVMLAVAGALVMLTGYRPLAGLVVALISASYFVLIKFVIMPRFGSWWFHDMYKDLFPAGETTFGGVIKTLLTNPLFVLGTLLTTSKTLHLLKIMLPLAFLPLRRTWLWVGFIPAILFTILTTGYDPTTATSFQYVYYWIPFIFVAAPIVLESIRKQHGRWKEMAAISAMAVATFATSYNWGVFFQRTGFVAAWGPIDLKPLTDQETRKLAALRELAAMAPREASISVSENENPHVSNRPKVYALRTGHYDADYVLYRLNTGGFGSDHANKAMATGKYARIAEKEGFALLKRTEPKK